MEAGFTGSASASRRMTNPHTARPSGRGDANRSRFQMLMSEKQPARSEGECLFKHCHLLAHKRLVGTSNDLRSATRVSEVPGRGHRSESQPPCSVEIKATRSPCSTSASRVPLRYLNVFGTRGLGVSTHGGGIVDLAGAEIRMWCLEMQS